LDQQKYLFAPLPLSSRRWYTSSMMSAIRFDDLPDGELLARVQDAVAHERCATAQLIALLMTVDARKLYLAHGCSSLYAYCTQVLHFSEHAAYARIEAARAARKFPAVLERLEDGSLTLTAVCLLRPHLTTENHIGLLDAAAHKTRFDVERLVAALRPRADVVTIIRKLSASDGRASAGVDAATEANEAHEGAVSTATAAVDDQAPNRATIKPLAPDRYWIQFTMSGEAHDNLRRVQNLLRHRTPHGDIGSIFERAISLLLEQTLKKKAALTDRVRSNEVTSTHTRAIPAAVRCAVWKRDEGRCAFKGSVMRCTETSDLNFHHVIPWAAGGATSVENIELRCRAHNVYEARQFFGEQYDERAKGAS
jgi:hypothetical protein